MRNVAPTRALSRRSRQWFQLAFFMVTFGAFMIAVGIAMNAIPLLAKTSSGYSFYIFVANALFVLGGVVVLVGIGTGIRALTWALRPDNDLARIVGNALSVYLDDRYTFVRNVSKRGAFYIDAVLVGPPGTLVFRIVNHTGIFLNEGDHWLKMNSNKEWMPWRVEPTREAIADIKSLQEFLGKRGLPVDTPIFGAVVFIKDAPMVQITVKSPAIPSGQLNAIYANLQGNYFAKERISKGAVDSIIKLIYAT